MADSLQDQITHLEQRLAEEPRSPLFARLASYYIQSGRSNDALRVCDEGLAHHPFYTTAHLIKGKALLELKMTAEARHEFEVVHTLLPMNESIVRLLSDLGSTTGEHIGAPSGPDTSGAADVAEEAALAPPPPSTVKIVKPRQRIEPREDVPTAPESIKPEPPPLVEEPVDDQSVVAEEPAPMEGLGEEQGAVQEELVVEENPTTGEKVPFVEEQAGATENAFGETVGFDANAGPETGEAAADTRETYEEFSEKLKAELAGTENTISLEEYLSSATGAASASSENGIEDLAAKLQSAKKITPIINLSDKTPPAPSEEGMPAGTSFVTPTLAEIYAKQGWFDDAIKAYKTLAAKKPAEKERFERRIKELEEQKKQQSSS